MRLAPATFSRLPPQVARFAYDRARQAVGIVHFGLGAFHRAHQAWYTDRAMDAGDRDWAICGVSLRSEAVSRQLEPQDGLYSVTARSGADAETRVVGAVREVLVAGRDTPAIMGRLTAPECRIASFTVTEKGYARDDVGGLDLAAAETGFYPLLAEALRRRAAAGLPGLTLLSCDNLAHNGAVLQRLVREWLAARAPDLVEWFAGECACPATMVDRIVPATSARDLDRLERRIGLRDEGAVFAERVSQWVIEDRFAGPRPRWDAVGAQFVSDVAPYETAKLRMLNGAHSALAYLGLERGHAFVHQAIVDPEVRRVVERLMRDEAAPTVADAPGLDRAAYADGLLARFADPALEHRLAQIAMDGSQKIPQRWLATLAARQREGADSPAVIAALGAWLRHLEQGEQIDDPLAGQLRAVIAERAPEVAIPAIFGPGGMLASDAAIDSGALVRAWQGRITS